MSRETLHGSHVQALRKRPVVAFFDYHVAPELCQTRHRVIGCQIKIRPDYFFAQDYATSRFDLLLLIARALGIPLIARHTGSRPECDVGRAIKRGTIPGADRLIISGHDELEMLATPYRVSRERLEVILTPIDTAAFRPQNRTVACQAAGLSVGRRYLPFIARLHLFGCGAPQC